jgi:hypothetical protein
MFHQLVLYGIHVHAFELFNFFLVTPHVEIVTSALPELPRHEFAVDECELDLRLRRAPLPRAQAPRDSLLEHLHHRRGRSFRRFAEQPVCAERIASDVNVVRHHDVSDE